MKHKEAIENHLCVTETRLFALEEKIILYDLTNTFCEGSGKYNPETKYGKSKERRNDCPLVTLGFVLDMHGFPKRSRIFESSVSEPGTLETMIVDLSKGILFRVLLSDPPSLWMRVSLPKIISNG